MRVLGGLAVALAVCLVAVSLTAYLKFRAVWDSIHRVQVTGLGVRPRKFTTAMNILLVGSDTRSGANRRFGAGISGQRSDTVIVLHLAPGGRSAIVLSIPRDSVVPILPCSPEAGAPGQTAQPGQVEQINATFANGGPGCLWKTVEHTTHLHIDHFIELNFTGFEHVVDDIGGVNICLPFAVNDPLSRLHLGPGEHHVRGAEALAFWRARYIGEGSDLQRIERDQYLMAAVLQGVEHSDLVGNPTRLVSVITDVARSMTTDAGLGLSTLINIAESLRQMKPADVQFIELPTVLYGPDPDWVAWPPSDRQLFRAIAHDWSVPRTASLVRPARRGQSRRGRLPRHRRAALAVYDPRHHPGPGASSPPGNLARRYGGITGNANICRNRHAFAGPNGGS
jgi:LCP family protein required for cell wall assembly